MMLRKTNNHQQQVERLQTEVNELSLDLKAILEEHDMYRLKGKDDDIKEWFNSLPIETLSDSLNKEHHRPRTKYSTHDMFHKFKLRKLYEKKKDELDIYECQLRVAKINYILAQIEGINNG